MEWMPRLGEQLQLSSEHPAKIGIPSVTADLNNDIRHHRSKRPHTKSRRGCFNCKARKVKCQETKPSCANCITRDLNCVYPSNSKLKSAAPSAHDRSILVSTRQLSDRPFTGDDLRFFHHFLLVARPYLPFGSEDSWTTVVPAYAHECPYLMHAILSLGATHYALTTPAGSQYTPMAIAHRGKALQLLATTLAKGDQCTESDLDGVLATCYTLVFQAFYMNDGLVDFAVFVRGCGTITTQIYARSKRSRLFLIQTREQVTAMVSPWLPADPYPDSAFVASCIDDIDQLRPFLQSDGDRAFFRALRSTYVALSQSMAEAFVHLTEIYAVWYTMENQEFMKFVATANHISRALFIHYFTIDTLMRPFMLNVGGTHRPGVHINATVADNWVSTIYGGLPSSMKDSVCRQVERIRSEKESGPKNLETGYII
ncbi:hypothetical protein BJX96DRAFT_142319 [Aspergillus floccosus]